MQHAHHGKVNRMGEYMKDRASELGHQVQYSAQRAKDWFGQTVDENPLAVGAAFFVLGLIGGLVIPASRPEDRLLGSARDRLVNRAQEAGSQLIERGQEVAQRAVGTVKEAVSGAAEGAESL